MTVGQPSGAVFAELIAPLTAEAFLDAYWGEQVLVIQGRTAERYAQLPTLDDFDQLLASLSAPQEGWFSLVKGQSRPPSNEMLTRDGTPDMAEIYGAVADGHSLLLTKLHRRHPATGSLCRALSAELGALGVLQARPAGANGYFTPPGAQGFAAHYDDHDVFILQLAGRKHWRLYGRVFDTPVEPPRQSIDPGVLGVPDRELDLSPGELIYIPRGFAHEARTDDSASLHLTLSVHPATWRDLFGEIALLDARLRGNLPRGFASRGLLSAADRQGLTAMAANLAASVDAAAVARVAGRVLAETDLPPTGGLSRFAEARKLSAESRIYLAPEVLAEHDVVAGKAVLRLPGASLRADPALSPLFMAIARGEPFRLGDLGADSVVAAALTVTQGLVNEGYLAVE